MYDCAVPGCKAKGVHNFPRSEQFRKLWEIACKTHESKIYNPTKTCKICATHFKPDDYFKEGFYTGVKNKKRVLKKNVIPSRFPWNTRKKSLLKKMGIDVDKKVSLDTEHTEPKISETKEVPTTSVVLQNNDETIEKIVEDVFRTSSVSSQNEDIRMGNIYGGIPSTNPNISQPSKIEKMEEAAPTFQQTPEVKITEAQILQAIQAQTQEKKQDKTELRLVKQRNKQIISVENFKNQNAEIFAHTGMESFEKFTAVFETLGQEAYLLQNRRNIISSEDQFFLTLIKLRHNKQDDNLAKLFSITPAVAANVFITWVDFLYEKWKMINLSPERVEILVSPDDYLTQSDRQMADGQQDPTSSTNKKGGKKEKAKSKKSKGEDVNVPTVPEIIPEGLSKMYTILQSAENIKHKFSCSSSPDAEFTLRQSDCEWEALQLQSATPHSHTTSTKSSWRRAVGSQWRPQSGCHYHCIAGGVGVRLVRGATTPTTTIQLCRDTAKNDLGCTQRKSPYQYATMVCSKYKERVRRLSGLGMQISPVLEEPDRPCRIACQDERVAHRFYLVNGQEGWFPLGTACGKRNASYCVSGKCLEFGPDNTPLSESVFTLPLLSRYNTSVSRSSRHRRSLRRRSLARDRGSVKATLQYQHLNDIIARLNLTNNVNEHITYFDPIPEHIEVDFSNPIHIAPEDTLLRKPPRPTWD